MKKILYMLLCLFLLVGCTHQTGGNTGSISTTPSITTPINTLKLEDHDQIMQRDFYSIAGEYINPTGETIYLTPDGDLLDYKVKSIDYNGDFYFCSIRTPAGKECNLFIYPIGKEVEYYIGINREIVETDTSKIRIAYGNAEITSSNQIYTKKEVVVTTTVSYTIAPSNPDPKDKSLIHIDGIPDDDLFEYINKLYYFVEEGIYRYVEYGSDQPDKDPSNPEPYDGFWINFNTKEYYYYIADSNSTPLPIVYNWEHDIGYITGQDCKYIYETKEEQGYCDLRGRKNKDDLHNSFDWVKYYFENIIKYANNYTKTVQEN